MKTMIALALVLFGLSAYDYSRPATCRLSTDTSIMGRAALYQKCSTPHGMYYTERFIGYVD